MDYRRINQATLFVLVLFMLSTGSMMAYGQSGDVTATATPQPFITNTPRVQPTPSNTPMPEYDLNNDVFVIVLLGANVRAEPSIEAEIIITQRLTGQIDRE